MDSDLDVHIADLCRGQHGAVSRAQLLLAGIGRNAIRRRITAGTLADIVGVAGDPLTDISAFRSVAFVMKDGAVVREPA